ncbi:MAG TPA: HTTM domain-containing protein [Pseudonocardia sp.]|nr:HTTM domain-containing protein [Pseudonocardia sp.]
MTTPFARLSAGWTRFWFEPQQTSTLGLFRIAYGFLVTLWTLSLLPNLFAFFGNDGIMPQYPKDGAAAWGVFELSTGTPLLIAVFVALLAGAVALTVGFHSRVAAVVVWVGVLSFAHRNPLIGNSGDELIGNVALFLALAPSGTSLSLDRLRSVGRDRFWEFPERAPWALRLVQIQLSVVYLSAVWDKVQGEMWRNGTAVSYALRIADVGRVPTPGFVTHSVVISELMTFGTLALETSLGILVWNRVARPWVLTLGILMHLGIDFSILVGFFSFMMIVCYLSFVPAQTASRRIIQVRDWYLRRKAARSRAREEDVAAPPDREGDDPALQTSRGVGTQVIDRQAPEGEDCGDTGIPEQRDGGG